MLFICELSRKRWERICYRPKGECIRGMGIVVIQGGVACILSREGARGGWGEKVRHRPRHIQYKLTHVLLVYVRV